MKKLSLTALLAGTALFTMFGTTTLSAENTKCGGDMKAPKANTKCGGEMTPPKASSRCGGEKATMKCGGEKAAAMKCGGEKQAPAAPKAAEKCGVGKCG